MSDHVLELLGAYLDGELSGTASKKVETHLAECQACKLEYESLQALSGMLKESPLPDFPSPERFASQVNLLLPHRPAQSPERKVLEVGWWMVPVSLLAAWVFLNTITLVEEMLTTANALGLLTNLSAWVAAAAPVEANFSATLGQFGLLAGNSLQWAEMAEIFTRATVPSLIWQASIALLYLCWIAIWWARRTRQGAGQSLVSGSRPTVR